MFTIILIVIYIAFIGLGFPNSLFGAAWPAIYEIATNAIEGVGSTWGSTYLVFRHGFGVEEAAKAITLYTIGMTLGRFLSGLLSTKLHGWRLIYLCSGIVLVSIVMMFIPISSVAVAGLFLVGLGNGKGTEGEVIERNLL